METKEIENPETKQDFDVRALLENILQVSNACCKDVYRYALNHVCVEPVGENIRIKATDGHMFAEVMQPSNGFKIETCLIPLDAMPTIKLLLKKSPHPGVFSFKQEKLKLTLSVYKEETTILCADATYPDTDRVKPDANREEITFGVNPELILKAAKALGMAKNKRNGSCMQISIDKNNKVAPIRVSMQGHQGLVMPMRI